MKPRIAIITSVIDNRAGRGTANVARELLARILPSDQFHVTLIHHESADDPLYGHHRTILIPHLPAPFDRVMLREAAFWLGLKERFDIVHYLTPRVWPSYLLTRANRIVITAHDAGVMLDLAPKTLADYAFRFTNRVLNFRMDRVIAVSEYARKEIMQCYGLSASRVIAIPNALSDGFARADTASVGRVRAQLGIATPYLLSVGRLDPHKNILCLVEAYAKARDAGLVLPLILVGGRHLPEYSHQVEKRIDDLGLKSSVIIAPFIEDHNLAALYTGAHAVLYPSLHEGFGLPLLEAFACRTPVAAADATSLPEVAGGAALLFDPNNTEAITDAFMRITNDNSLRTELIEKGLARLEHFSWDRSAEMLRTLYRFLVASTK